MISVRQEIDQKVAWLEDRCHQLEARLEVASDAGAVLAAEVHRFLRYPETGVPLRQAYSTFMTLHASNFVPHPELAVSG